MKERICIAFLLIVVLLFSGCGKSNEARGVDGAATATSSEPTYTYIKPDDTEYRVSVNNFITDFFHDYDDVVAQFTVDDDYAVFTMPDLIQYMAENDDCTLNPMVTVMWGNHSPFHAVYLFGDNNCYILHKDTDGTVLVAMLIFDAEGMPSINQLKKIDGKLPVNEANAGTFTSDDRVMKVMREHWENAVNAIGVDTKNMIPYTSQETIRRFGIHGNVYAEIPFTDVSPTMPVYFWDAMGEKGFYVILSVEGDVWAREIVSVIEVGTKSVIDVGEPMKGKIEPLDLEAIQRALSE